jgi:hypothetical protein
MYQSNTCPVRVASESWCHDFTLNFCETNEQIKMNIPTWALVLILLAVFIGGGLAGTFGIKLSAGASSNSYLGQTRGYFAGTPG